MASTTPIASWPIGRPGSVAGSSLYGQRSLPQMQARVTRITASVELMMVASGTFSMRTSPALYMTVARMVLASCLRLLGLAAGEVLLVGHPFHPAHDIALGVAFLDRDVRHRGGRR